MSIKKSDGQGNQSISCRIYLQKIKNIYCGKANTIKNNQNIIGYVLDEDQDNFEVLLTNDQIVMMKKRKIMSLVGDNRKIKLAYYQYENIEE